ncbi:MAG: DUF4292 domain-containing protein [Flavobacteriia bacterium]|nr:DUF4292 domain-containing protein [Flavobacteriia bacterium]
MSFHIPSLNRFFALVFLLALSSCGAKKAGVVKGNMSVNTSLGSKAVIKNHYGAAAQFKTLSGRMKIEYSSGDNSQGIPATFRMEKDKALWLSVFFGMGKAYITPQRVAFYSSVNNVYFDGDFKALSAYVGTPLDFKMIQGLLLGESAVDLKTLKFKLDQTAGVYRLKPQRALAFFKLFIDLDPSTFKVVQSQISQASQQSNLLISYPSYTPVSGVLLPNSIDVQAQLGSTEAKLSISYKSLVVDRSLNFPFKIPNGLKALSLPAYGE